MELQLSGAVKHHPAELARVREELTALLRKGGVPDKTLANVVLAVDEALSSMMFYNREKGFDHDLSLSIDLNDVRFKATLTDPRTDFGGNPTYRQLHGDRKYKISFYVICKVMDEVSYSFKRGFENRLDLVKFL